MDNQEVNAAIIEEPAVLSEKRGHVMLITLNRPKAGNSVNPDLAWGLENALNMAEADPEVFAVVLTGSGSKIFCGGMDLKYLAAHGNQGVYIGEHGLAGFIERWFSKPIICAVNGAAMGGGCEFALACDLIVAAENAKFGQPEVKRGILAAGGGPIRLMRSVPKAIALELLLTGDPISAQRALEIGLVNKVVPVEELIPAALELAERITVNAPIAVKGTKELAYKSIDMDVKEAFELSGKIRDRIYKSEDSKEGPRAFAEKRAPVWKNR